VGGVQFPPEPRDPGVDATVKRLTVAIAEQLGAIKDTVRSSEQGRKKAGLGNGQLDLLASWSGQAVGALLECPAAEPGARTCVLPRLAAAHQAPQDRVDAGDHLARLERLHHIVVGAALQSENAVLHALSAGQDQGSAV